MKLSAFLISYQDLYDAGATTYQVIDKALEQGFKAIEPFTAPDISTAEQAKAVGSYIRERGAEVSCYSACVDLLSGAREDVLRECKQHIDIAAALGSPYFHHTIYPDIHLPRYSAPSFGQALKKAMTILPELCRYAEDKGVLCAYEDQGMYFNGCANMQRLVDAMEDVPFGFVADLGNIFFVDEQPESFIGAFSNKIVHVHCKDYRLCPGNQDWPGEDWYMSRSGNFLQDVLPGEGIVEFRRIFRMLEQIGYDGWYSVEYVEGSQQIGQVKEALQALYASVQKENVKVKGL